MVLQSVPREAALIVNAQSRRGDDLFQQAREKLLAAGFTLVTARAVHDPAELGPAVRRAVQGGVPMVIVGGGDGTLSGAIDELVNTGCVFAALPLGTANSFARTLGIPLDLDAAVACIANGRRHRIDLGMIDGDYFLNSASIGLSPTIGETIPHRLKKYLGRIGYLAWAARCFLRLRPFRLILDDGTGERRMWSTEVRVLNGRFHGGVELTEETNVDSGDIVVQAVTGRNRFSLILDWFAKAFKLRDRNAHTEDFRGREFRLDTRPHLRISIDGEVLAKTPVTVRIALRAVEVVAPCDYETASPPAGGRTGRAAGAGTGAGTGDDDARTLSVDGG